jgi:hypothetical protein
MKYNDTTFTDSAGVKVTICEYRAPKKAQRTFDVDKSKYTAWTQGVSNYTRGVRGVLGTMENVK